VHLETLRLYCDCPHRSFSRGARKTSCPIAAKPGDQQLEGSWLALLDRTKRPFVVTPEGHAFYEACRGLLGLGKGEAEIAAVKGAWTARSGAAIIPSLHDVTERAAVHVTLPEARVQLEACTRTGRRGRRAGEADVGSCRIRRPTGRWPPCRCVEPMASCHPNHRLARAARHARRPNGETFVAFDAG